MTEEMNMGAYCFCFTWDNKLVGFVSALSNPCKGITNAWRFSRIVVMPDFQGMGIGCQITEFIASIFKANGLRMYIKTVNPRLGEYIKKSEKWRATAMNGKTRTVGWDAEKYPNRLERASYNYEYIGGEVKGYEELMLPTERMRYNKSMEGQLSLW